MKLHTAVKECKMNEDIIYYPKGHTVVIAKEFNVYNVGDEIIYIQINDSTDLLELEPGEGFDTAVGITHAVIKTDGAKVKYTYWS